MGPNSCAPSEVVGRFLRVTCSREQSAACTDSGSCALTLTRVIASLSVDSMTLAVVDAAARRQRASTLASLRAARYFRRGLQDQAGRTCIHLNTDMESLRH